MRVCYFDRVTSITGIVRVVLIVLLTLMLPTLNRAAAPDEWSEVFDAARAVLAKMPDATRIETTIKDPALREAVMRAIQALRACAKMNRDQGNSVKEATLAEFARSFKAVQSEVERSEYQACASECKSKGASCEKECQSAKKRLCACKLNEFGCFMTKCVFG